MAFLDHQHRALPGAEPGDLVGHERIGHVEAEDRHLARAERIGEAQFAQRAQHRVVDAALADDADLVERAGEKLVELAAPDEVDRGREAVGDLVLLLRVCGGRKTDAGVIEIGLQNFIVLAEGGRPVVLRRKAPVHVAGADAELHDDGRARGLGQLIGLGDEVDEARVVGPRVHEPHRRLHGEGVRALLDDRGALAVILADDDDGAALDAGRGEVRERVRRDVGANRRFPHGRAAHRIVDRGGEHRGGARLVGGRREMDAELVQERLRVAQHVHQVRDRRALIARDIADAGLQQALGDGEDAFALEHVTGALAQKRHFLGEGPFHANPLDLLYISGSEGVYPWRIWRRRSAGCARSSRRNRS